MKAQFITATEVAEIMGISVAVLSARPRNEQRAEKTGLSHVAGKCPAQIF
jgi:hypothetical protein